MDLFKVFRVTLLMMWILLTLVPGSSVGAPDDYLNLYGITDRDQAIETYFNLGFAYQEIVAFLCLYNGVSISLRHLKRILKGKNLRRKLRPSFSSSVTRAIQAEISCSGGDLGYRLMHDRIRYNHDIVTSRENVRLALSRIDPEGVLRRRRRRLRRRIYHSAGPNYLWHIDGWDKLKQFGLCVHGCIDGYSRKLIWLEAASTNNDPFVIAQYFKESVLKLGGLPTIVRSDRGTENVNIEVMQTVLRSDNVDERGQFGTAFLYGKSTANQRIEGWWSKFGSLGMTTWIKHFKELEQMGIIDTSKKLDIECILFCYVDLLRKELNQCMVLWNTHTIRKSVNNSVSSKPDVLYYVPEAFGCTNCMQPLDQEILHRLSDMLTKAPPNGSDLFRELFHLEMEFGNKSMPTNLTEAADLLTYLLDSLSDDFT